VQEVKLIRITSVNKLKNWRKNCLLLMMQFISLWTIYRNM